MTGAEFSAEVARRHRRIDASGYATIYVVGDVHGCIAELRTLWGRLDPGDDDLVVFVGDLVGKGPASGDAVEFVRTRANAVSVRGNYEDDIIHGRTGCDLSTAHRETLESLPLVVSWNDAMVVHGGVNPNRPLSEHSPRDLLETRAIPPENGYDGPFWFEFYEGPPRIFFGHTVLTEPFVGVWAVGLDTGCVAGGTLTAYDCRRDVLVSVPAERTYSSRSDDRIAQP